LTYQSSPSSIPTPSGYLNTVTQRRMVVSPIESPAPLKSSVGAGGTFTMITLSGTTSGVMAVSAGDASASRRLTFSWIL